MSPPRLVATDLDGTLVRSDNTVSAYTQQVLAELDERDVPVVFVTGRPLRWAEDVFDHVGRHGLAVISNGALVWDVAGDRPVALRGHRAGGRPRGRRADPGRRPGERVRHRDAGRHRRWSRSTSSATPYLPAAAARRSPSS